MNSPGISVTLRRASRWVRVAAVGLLGLIVAVIVFIHRAPQFEFFLKAQPANCMLKRMTGIPCLGCRGTRAAFAFAHGDLAQSLVFNPLAFALGVFILGWTLLMALTGRYPAVSFQEPWGKLAILLLIFFLIGNWAYVIRVGG